MKQGPLMDRLIKKKEWPILWHSSNWLLHIFKLLQKTTRRRFIIDWSIYFTFGTNNIALLCEQSSKGVGLYGGKKFPFHLWNQQHSIIMWAKLQRGWTLWREEVSMAPSCPMTGGGWTHDLWVLLGNLTNWAIFHLCIIRLYKFQLIIL